jgi:hypothetical protein
MTSETRHFKLTLIFRAWAFWVLLAASPQLPAHPMEYHLRPLDAASVERVLDSLDRMVTQLRENDSLASASLPDDAMGISAIVWSMQDAVLSIDDSTPADSETLNSTLAASGYTDPEIQVYEWQLEAERVLETYEVLVSGIDMTTVNAGFTELERDRASLPEDEAREREAALYRNEEMLRTTAKDLELISHYRPRLDALVGRLGSEGE